MLEKDDVIGLRMLDARFYGLHDSDEHLNGKIHPPIGIFYFKRCSKGDAPNKRFPDSDILLLKNFAGHKWVVDTDYIRSHQHLDMEPIDGLYGAFDPIPDDEDNIFI